MFVLMGGLSRNNVRGLTCFAILVFGLVVIIMVAAFNIKKHKDNNRQREQARAERKLAKEREQAQQRLLEQRQRRADRLQKKQEQLKAEYSKKYEERKITIGTIKCSQCEWSGQWGTGMSYKQFFAGDLAEHEIYVGRSKGEKSSLSLNNRQYECPVCNSLSWEKV
mgnify:CR=1 FL=1